MTRSSLSLFAALLLALAPSATAQPSQDVAAWLDATEKGLMEHMVRRERATWMQDNFITFDTETIAAQEAEATMQYVAQKAAESRAFDGKDLTYDQKRKIYLLRTWIDAPAPQDPAKRAELAAIMAKMQGTYGSGKYCRPDGKCLTLDDLSDILATSRDPAQLQEAWVGWRTISVPMRDDYARFVALSNEGASDLGFHDLGEMWRSRYDMDPAAFQADVDRLWNQVRPLYLELHTYVRGRLQEKYGKALVPDGAPIPAHLLGNMWAQDWQKIEDLLLPPSAGTVDLDGAVAATGWDEKELAHKAEAFFTGLGFTTLPGTFWERSLFVKPADREVVCHASAWDVDFYEDVRIKMCIKRDYENLATLHHELGHIYYYWTVRNHSALYRDDASDAFNEAIGDTLQLSVTPSYLQKIGVLKELPPDVGVGPMLQKAIDGVAFLPFGLVVDRWRWDVFSGEVGTDQYNAHWWDLAKKYQGVAPPVPRTEADFDPGAKYHIPANVPYTRYFQAAILQYQFHRALCAQQGHKGPLHTCSIAGNPEAGRRIEAMMAMGSSKPWPDALEALTGQREMDATAILDYYKPLYDWLKKQNKGKKKGW